MSQMGVQVQIYHVSWSYKYEKHHIVILEIAKEMQKRLISRCWLGPETIFLLSEPITRTVHVYYI